MKNRQRNDWAAEVATDVRSPALFGLGGVALALGGFLLWSCTAPLAGATIASGVVAASGRNQAVQHPDGGTIAEVLAHEGDRVVAGQPMFAFEDGGVRAERNRTEKALVALLVRSRRLAAERDGSESVDFGPDLVRRAEAAGLSDVVAEQRAEFEARRRRFSQEGEILRQRLSSLEEESKGLVAQERSYAEQAALVDEEAGRKKKLLEKGLTQRSQYTDLLRSKSDVAGRLGQVQASILSSRTKAVEASEQIARLDSQRVEDAVKEAAEIRERVADLDERLVVADKALARTVVRAGSDGIVVSSIANAPGAVVAPGQRIAEILPTGKGVLVEARLPLSAIDEVRVGQDARLRFQALGRTAPEVPAKVAYVSADRLVDERTQQGYYVARLEIAEALPAGVDVASLHPGMPVEAFLSTGERTFASYVVQPITDSFAMAFRQ